MNNVLITGATRGIGRELAIRFMNDPETSNLILIGRSKDRMDELVELHSGLDQNNKLIPIVSDVATDECLNVLDNELKQLGQLNFVVNNAATLINKPFLEISVKELEDLYKVNVFSAVNIIQRTYPYLNKSNPSHIVNISSMGGFQGASKFPGLSAYSSSKAALACLTECLAEEFNGDVPCNALAFGAVNTEMLNSAFPDYKAPLDAPEMAEYVHQFTKSGWKFYNGKILPVSLSTP